MISKHIHSLSFEKGRKKKKTLLKAIAMCCLDAGQFGRVACTAVPRAAARHPDQVGPPDEV